MVRGLVIFIKSMTFSMGYRRRLARSPSHSKFASRTSARRLNHIIQRFGADSSYLEIGLERGLTFEAVKAKKKVGVDPRPLFRNGNGAKGVSIYEGNSDQFFASLGERVSFDLVFVDGLHDARQAYSDFVNACRHSSLEGVVVIDDVLPSDGPSAMPDRRASDLSKKQANIHHMRWYGDVWKVLLLLLTKYPEILISVLEDDLDEHVQVAASASRGLCNVEFSPVDDLEFMEGLTFEAQVASGKLRRLLEAKAITT